MRSKSIMPVGGFPVFLNAGIARLTTSAGFAAFAGLAVLSALATSVGAQTGASRFALAQVSDPRGRAVIDVDVDDFVIQEGGAERDVLDVHVADYPIVLVLDNGRAASADLPAIRSAAVRLVERLGPRPIAIVAAGGSPRVVVPLDEDRATLLEYLGALEPATDEESEPLRAAALAANTIRATGALFSAIIAVTASPAEVTGPAADALMAPIIDSGAMMHVIANRADRADRADSTNRGGDSGGGAASQFLRGLADQTHGDFTAIYASPSYQPAIDRLAARLTTELVIEYIVPVGSRANDVKIGVRLPGAHVRGLGVAPR
jgi:hypothetical protein